MVKITLDYLGITSNNLVKFKFTTFTTLANYQGTESVTGYEDLSTRILEIDYSNTTYLKNIINYFGLSNQRFYNPFSIPISNYSLGNSIKIWDFNHDYVNSSKIKFLFSNYECNTFFYSSSDNMIVSTAFYEEVTGILIHSYFQIIGSNFNISANLDLHSTNLFANGEIPISTYILVGLIFIGVPLLVISIKVFRNSRKKLIKKGGL